MYRLKAELYKSHVAVFLKHLLLHLLTQMNIKQVVMKTKARFPSQTRNINWTYVLGKIQYTIKDVAIFCLIAYFLLHLLPMNMEQMGMTGECDLWLPLRLSCIHE
jgi:hypothetical protein